ncbi:hypothetical protein CEXT_618441 [Caerostris extrusa]|uniref:Uncharacterized protein n=1 Tax=Caerostris extrusa TaxID=172846 RepID=A0AAV4WBP6_CAEEX|nr:hypothetical protein CEXT_618441 [Caerostris extrusa]
MESASLLSASSHFLTEEGYIKLAEWRFIHKGKFYLVPQNGAELCKRSNNEGYRRCTESRENPTILDVLPHGIPKMTGS